MIARNAGLFIEMNGKMLLANRGLKRCGILAVGSLRAGGACRNYNTSTAKRKLRHEQKEKFPPMGTSAWFEAGIASMAEPMTNSESETQDTSTHLENARAEETVMEGGDESTTIAPVGLALEDIPLHDTFRNVMRRMPRPVVVLTTTPWLYETNKSRLSEDPKAKGRRATGVTLSSFNTVTLSPYPIISFNIGRPSRTFYDLKKKRDAASKNTINAYEKSTFHIYIFDATTASKNYAAACSIPWDNRTAEKGFYRNSQGARWRIDCQILEDGKGFIDVSDHTLVLAKVVGMVDMRPISLDSPAVPEETERWASLMYKDGDYEDINGTTSLPAGNYTTWHSAKPDKDAAE